MEERRLARARPAGDADEGAVGERERRRREGGDLPAAAAARVTDRDLVELEERPVALVRRHVPPRTPAWPTSRPQRQGNPDDDQAGDRRGRERRPGEGDALAPVVHPERAANCRPRRSEPGRSPSRVTSATLYCEGGLSTPHRTIRKTPSAHLRQEDSANGLLRGLAMGRRSWIVGSALAVGFALRLARELML